MNREEILAMEAGRELDVLLANEIFGIYASEAIYSSDNRATHMVIPTIAQHYSTDIKATWQVMEKMRIGDNETWFSFSKQVEGLCGSDERVLFKLNPEIICKAALLAKLEGGNP